MTTYRELLEQTKAEISEVDARAAQELADAVWLDVREADEWQEGHVPGARHVPRGFLESRIETTVPAKDTEIVVYCADAQCSASIYAYYSLERAGYRRVRRYPGGIADWEAAGYPLEHGTSAAKPGRSRIDRVAPPTATDTKSTNSRRSRPCSCCS